MDRKLSDLILNCFAEELQDSQDLTTVQKLQLMTDLSNALYTSHLLIKRGN